MCGMAGRIELGALFSLGRWEGVWGWGLDGDWGWEMVMETGDGEGEGAVGIYI